LDELLEMNVEVLIIDKDRDVVDVYKDSSATAIIMDVMNAKTFDTLCRPRWTR